MSKTPLLALCCLATAACSGGRPDHEVGLAETGTTVVPVDDSLCAQVPGPRRFAQSAGFYLEHPIWLTDQHGRSRTVQHGIVLYGGEHSGHALDDLWVFDAGGRYQGFEDACDWIQLSADATGVDGVSRGSLHWDADDTSLVLVGGYRHEGGDVWATAREQRLDLSAGATVFTNADLLADSDVQVRVRGSEQCNGLDWHEVWDDECYSGGGHEIDPCTDVTTHEGTSTECAADDVQDDGPYDFACVDDPYCTVSSQYDGETWPAPGRAGHGVAWFGSDGVAWAVGGVTGCRGGSCGDWENLFEADTTGDRHVDAAALADVAAFNSGWTSRSADMVEFTPRDWPDATTGLWGTSVAALGLGWDLSAGDYVHQGGTRSAAVYGGTRYGAVAPERRRTLTCTSATSCDEVQCLAWEASEAPAPYWADAADALLDADDMLLLYQGGIFSPPASTPSFGAVRDAAMVALGPEQVLTLGGRDATGAASSELRVIELGSGFVETLLPGGWHAVYGATLARDPVKGDAYFFGGHDSDTTLHEVRVPAAQHPSSLYGLRMSEVQAELTYDGAGSWDEALAFTLTETCVEDNCFADELIMVLGDDQLGGAWDSATVDATWPDGDTYRLNAREQICMEDYSEDPDCFQRSGSAYVGAVYDLPRVLGSGDTIEIAVSYPSEPHWGESPWGALTSRSGFAVYTYGEGASASQGYLREGLPAWVGWDNGLARVAVDRYTVTVPAGYTAVSTGTLLSGTSHGAVTEFVFEDLPETVIPSGRHVAILETLAAPVRVTASTGGAVDVYVDTGLSATAQAEYTDYLAGDFPAHLAAAETALGGLPYDPLPVIALRPHPDDEESVNGFAQQGLTWVMPSRPDGPRDAHRAEQPVLLHEVVHAWFGGAIESDAGGEWVIEAVPELFEWTFHPTSPHTEGVYFEALDKAVSRHVDPSRGGINPTDDGDLWAVKYRYGSYVLTQLLHQRVADGAAPDFETALGELGDLLTFANDGLLGVDGVEDWLRSMGRHTFFQEWIASGAIGLPLLGLQDLTYDGTGHHGSVEVRQTQQALYGWPLFTDVPFWLACGEELDPGRRSIIGCDADGVDREAVPGLTSSESSVVPLIHLPIGGPREVPAWFALRANEGVHPGGVELEASIGGSQVTSSGRQRADTWVLVCGGVASAGCDPTLDLDGDGFPASEDCDDSDPTIHPAATLEHVSPVVHDGTDYNCDGVANPW